MSKTPDDDIILQELARERPARPVFWAFFFLGVACVAAKTYFQHSLWNFFEHKRREDWILELAVFCQRDAAFVIVAGMASAALLAITRPLNWFNKWLYRLIRLFALLCVVYLVVAMA